MPSADSAYFDSLPPLQPDFFRTLAPGKEIRLFLLERFEAGGSAVFPVRYVHKELTYRTPGNKDAAAYGTARLEDDGTPHEVRILFSQYHRTASMKGLELEGPVKLGA